mgnify:FL=1
MNLFFRIITWPIVLPFKKIFGRKKEPELNFNSENVSGQQFPTQQYQQPYAEQTRQQYGGQEEFMKDYGQGYTREQNERGYQTTDKQEIILSKLEVISAKLDNLNQRLQALERNRERLW